jgi:hypothetical protein
MNKLEYGIICNKSDEKQLVKNINHFLDSAYEYRKMSKVTNKSMLQARLPFVFTHFYSQFLKTGVRWYFELYPNSDEEGKLKFLEHPEAGWLIWVNKMSYSTDAEKSENDRFFEELLQGTGFEWKLLYTYKEKEERL